MFEQEIDHAKFRLPKPEVHAQHPFRNPHNHHELLEYCQQRLRGDMESRDSRVARYAQIDRDVAAWVKLSDEDRKRQRKHEQDGSPQATQVSLPLTWVHIDDMMTYYAQTFAPNRGMFYHTAAPGEAEGASQLVALMNNHAIYGSYYRHLLRAIFNILKYNSGGLVNNWATDYGPKLEMALDGTMSVGSQPIFRGNKIQSVDMYNFFYDPSVDPTCLYKDGEWFATVEMKSHYWLKSKCLEGTYFNCEELLDGEWQSFSAKYYKSPPVESRIQRDESASSGVNWYNWMSGSEASLVNNAFELTTVYIRINPNDFGLVPGNAQERAQRNRYEIWRVVIANDEKLIQVQHMPNIHGYLPAFFGVLNDDGMGPAAKSSAEILNPLQQFASFLLNAHVLANRKNIFGTTFYDPSRIDYSKVAPGEVAARVPTKPQGYGQDIRTMILHDNNTLDTKQTLGDFQGIIDVINQFFPTQALPSQIAGIDRAVTDQVAAVQQGTNRRQQKGARLLDDTMMRPLRFALYYNIIQFLQDGEEVADYFTGQSERIDLTTLRGTSLVHLIGQGLKALDRQQVATSMREIIFALIQAPQAGERVDILGMLDYWTSMQDVDMNMKQFEVQAPPAAGAPGVDAGGNPVAPATAPGAIAGGPIYGA